jgi:hypothetical protein
MRRRGIMDMGVGMVMPMGMDVGVVVVLGVGRGGNHHETLYYNITHVYRCHEINRTEPGCEFRAAKRRPHATA